MKHRFYVQGRSERLAEGLPYAVYFVVDRTGVEADARCPTRDAARRLSRVENAMTVDTIA